MTEAAPVRVGPVALLLPLLVMALTIAWLVHRRSASGPPLEPEGAEARLVDVLVGRTPASAGGRHVEARLTRLHSSPARQEFDRRTLAARLGLGAGEPWLLELAWIAGEPDGATAPGESARWALDELIVVDDAGVALRPVQAGSPPGTSPGSSYGRGDGAAGEPDPIRALIAPPAGALAPGQAVELCLWGRAPGTGARLVGGSELALTARREGVRDLPRSLARLVPQVAPDAAHDGTAAPDSAREDLREPSVR